MTKPSIDLQELRRRIYRKAKAEKTWWFWGLYVHICKLETLRAAYQEAKANDGVPGLDEVSFRDRKFLLRVNARELKFASDEPRQAVFSGL